jgi:arginine utilization protein RocB
MILLAYKRGDNKMSTIKKMQTKEQLIELLCELVSVKSITGTPDEVKMANTIVEKLAELRYYQDYPEYLQLHPTGDGRYFVMALAKKENTKKTVVMVNHFDVVNVEDYGMLQEEAFDPYRLKELMCSRLEEYTEEVQEHLQSDEWLFGRGIMDMKAGLTLQMSLLEKAALGEFDGNLVLLAVPDEEANSEGMRKAVPALLRLAQQYDLEYELILNSEPMFTQYPGDTNQYLYTGSIGKVMPGFLCYGRETHVGEPLSGLNANLMSSLITAEMELNTHFCETSGEQTSPPPTSLIQKDLKLDYSVQIPHRAVNLYNLFIFERSLEKIVNDLLDVGKRVGKQIESLYQKRADSYAELQGKEKGEQSVGVGVLTFEQIRNYAMQTYGAPKVQEIEQKIYADRNQYDDRQLTIKIVDEYAMLCKDLAPMIVLFFAPPYYPAVGNHNDEFINMLTGDLKNYAEQKHDISLENVRYYNGISDLSYVNLKEDLSSLGSFIENVPVWDVTYSIPVYEMKQLRVPVLNVGPVGRDPHQQTERLHADYAFTTLKDMAEHLLAKVFAFSKKNG